MRGIRALAASAVLALLGNVTPAQAPARVFSPEEMVGIVDFVPGSEPTISPDGLWVAFASIDRSLETNILAAHPDGLLWVKHVSEAPVRVGDGDYADSPVWSPDGQRMTFFRTRKGQRQLCVWTAATGAVRELGESFAKDLSLQGSPRMGPQWSPDGSTILYPALVVAAPRPEPETTLLHSTDEAMPFDKPFLDARRWTLTSVDVRSGKTRALTPQPVSVTQFAVAADGKVVLFRATTPETVTLFRRERSQDWVVPAGGSGAPQAVLKGRTPAWVVFAPNGNELLFPEKGALRAISITGNGERVVIEHFPEKTRSPVMSSKGLLAVSAARPGTGPPDPRMYSILEPTWDVDAVNVRAGQLQVLTEGDGEVQHDSLVWSGDGGKLFYRAVDQGTYRESLHAWNASGGGAREIYAADEAIRALGTTRDGSELSFTAMSGVHPEEGFALQTNGGRPMAVTDLNPGLAAYIFQAPQIFSYSSADGDPLKALLYLPSGADADHPVPVVTYVYEKLSEYRNRFDPEAQWYVAHGYGYLMPDVLVKVAHTADSYVKSVIPAVNHVRAMGVTTGRFGINGGSMGGFAGMALISHSDIFAAAVLRAPPTDFFSTWGDGRDRDLWTIEAGQARMSGTPWNQRDTYIDNSPFFQADRVHTPVLIVHGEADFTVPFEQGLMMFSALRALHRTADLLIYRDGEHSIVRGSHFRYIDFHEHTMAWWEKYLRTSKVADATGEGVVR